jgi:phosphatidylglycerol:prolipoprotein diacylglycerol transferase
MIVYPVVRFADEFFRGDTYRGFFLGLSTSQWISIMVFVFSITMLIIKHFKKSEPKPDAAE